MNEPTENLGGWAVLSLPCSGVILISFLFKRALFRTWGGNAYGQASEDTSAVQESRKQFGI